MATETKPFDWSTTPVSWTEVGQRLMFEIYDLMADNHTGSGSAKATPKEITHAVDRAIRSVTPLATVQAWVADKCSDIPEVAR